jgi:hypothetical protein
MTPNRFGGFLRLEKGMFITAQRLLQILPNAA